MNRSEELVTINGFSSASEYKRFLKYIESRILDDDFIEVVPDMYYGKGEIYGGRWFQHNKSKEIWRLVEPDYPFKGLWEKVENL